MDRWQQHQAELLSRDDRAGFWLKVLSAPSGDAEGQASAQPAVHAETPMAEYAGMRGSLGIDRAGLDRDQVQMTGRRGDVPVPQPPGWGNVRAAAALGHPMGQDARAEYGERQREAAEAINGFRPGR